MKKETIKGIEDFEMVKPNTPELRNVIGMLKTVDTIPTDHPIKFSEQFRIYKNGAAHRFYGYDSVNHVWGYVTLL